MKYLLFVVITFSFTSKASSQEVVYPEKSDSSFIKIKEYYKGCGKIISNLRNNNLLPLGAKDIFAPTAIELLSAEQLMNEEYSNLIKSDERTKTLAGTHYKQHYYKYYRQYVGIINDSGDRIIFVQLFTCCKKNINKCFPDWKKELVTPLTEDSCDITIRFIIDLTQKKIALL